MGRIFRCIKKFVIFGLVCAFITFCPGIPPNATYVPYGNQMKAPQKLITDLILNNAERLLEGQLVGAEAFAVHKGVLYTGLHGGHVVKVLPDKVLPVVKTGKECAGIHEEHICGRPLGLRVKNGVLYIADAYYGIFSHMISIGSGNLNHILGPNLKINGKPVKVFNSVAVAQDGTLYFTSSSSEFDINKGVHAMFTSGTGRLLKFDPKTKLVTQLLDNMHFPNGVAISADEKFLLIAETITRKVLKYQIKTGKVQPILEGLPGVPDNIQYAGDDTFWVSLVTPSDDETPALSDVLADWPNIRKFLGRFFFLAEFPFKFINQYYPNYFCEQASYHIGHLGPLFAVLPEKVTIVKFDGKSGQILEVLHGNNGVVRSISDVAVVGDYMYLGSPANNFIGRVTLPKGKYVQTEEAAKGKYPHSEANMEEAAEEALDIMPPGEGKYKMAALDDRAKKAAEEARAQKAAEEAKAKKAAEEAKAKKAAEEAKAKKAAEEAKAKKAAEEAKAKKAAEEAKAKKAAEEAKAKKAAEEAKAKMAAEEAKPKKAAEEAKAKKAAEDPKKVDKPKEAAANKKTSDEIKTNKVADNAGTSKVAGDKVKTEL